MMVVNTCRQHMELVSGHSIRWLLLTFSLNNRDSHKNRQDYIQGDNNYQSNATPANKQPSLSTCNIILIDRQAIINPTTTILPDSLLNLNT